MKRVKCVCGAVVQVLAVLMCLTNVLFGNRASAAEVVPYVDTVTGAAWPPALEARLDKPEADPVFRAESNHIWQAIAAAAQSGGSITNETDPVFQAESNHIWQAIAQAAQSGGSITNELDIRAMKLFHYGDPDIVVTPTNAFMFDSSTGTLTGYDYDVGGADVVIPWEIDGVAVRIIADGVFSGVDKPSPLQTFVAPRTLKTIDGIGLAGVFYWSTSLTTVKLPSVEYIGIAAFVDCTSLTNIIFSGDAPVFGEDVFVLSHNPLHNPNLRLTVTDPAAKGWPSEVQGVPVVRTPLHTDSLTLGGVERSTWPEGGGGSTNTCDRVAMRIWHYGSPDIVESPAEWFEFNEQTRTIIAYPEAPARELVVIPWEINGVPVEHLAPIWMLAPPGATRGDIGTLILPRSIESAIKFLDYSPSVPSISHLIAPGVTNVGDSALSNTSIRSLDMPALRHAGKYAFASMSHLTNVSLPRLESLGWYSFSNCDSLPNVNLPSLGAIPTNCYINCSSLTNGSFGAAHSIAKSAFVGCSALESLYIPACTNIEAEAFSFCSSLNRLHFSGGTPPPEMDPTVWWPYSGDTLKIYVDAPFGDAWPATIQGLTVVRPGLHTDSLTLGGVERSTWPEGGGGAAVDTSWMHLTNHSETATLTAGAPGRPVAVTFDAVDVMVEAVTNLVVNTPYYFALAGATSLMLTNTFTLVGGGSFQTNRWNHFQVWTTGESTFIQPIAATEEL